MKEQNSSSKAQPPKSLAQSPNQSDSLLTAALALQESAQANLQLSQSIQSLVTAIRAQADAIADLAESVAYGGDGDDDEPQTLDGR